MSDRNSKVSGQNDSKVSNRRNSKISEIVIGKVDSEKLPIFPLVCVECLIAKQKKPILFKVTEPSSVPYRAPSACAKMAAYPIPVPECKRVNVCGEKSGFGPSTDCFPIKHSHTLVICCSKHRLPEKRSCTRSIRLDPGRRKKKKKGLKGVHVYIAYMVYSCVCFSSSQSPTSKPMTILQLLATRLIRRSFAIAAVSSSTATGAPSAWRVPIALRGAPTTARRHVSTPRRRPPPHLAPDNFRWADFS